MKPDDTVYLLVGHGSRNAAGNRETLAFADAWRARHPGRHVEVCFIEHAEPSLDAGLDRAARQAGRVRVLPLILSAAGHVKEDVPQALERARQRHPRTAFSLAAHLGVGRAVQAVLQGELGRLMHGLDSPDPRTTGVIVLGRGSSDDAANGELARLVRWLYEANHHELIDLAFTGVTWPRLETVVQRQVRLGMTQLCILPAYLFTGVLIERIAAQVARLTRQYPHIAFALGAHFGCAPGILALLDARADEAAPSVSDPASDPSSGLHEPSFT